MLIRSGFFALALAAAVATPALADPSGATAATERVTYDDLNLASPSGAKVLSERIRAAANQVCDWGGMQTTEEFSKSGQCFRRAFADGERQMNQLIASRSSGAAVGATALIISAK
jgi:UrcA family protein